MNMDEVKKIIKMNEDEFSAQYSVEAAMESLNYIRAQFFGSNPDRAQAYENYVSEKEENLAALERIISRKYGSEPLLITILLEKNVDKMQIGLIIDGKINLYPVETGIYDSAILSDFIGNCLNLPSERNLVMYNEEDLPKDFLQVEWTDIDTRWFFDKTMSWLMGEVEPKPKLLNVCGDKYKLQRDGKYKFCRF